MSSYDSICRGVDGALVKTCQRLREAFNFEAHSLHQGVCDAVRVA